MLRLAIGAALVSTLVLAVLAPANAVEWEPGLFYEKMTYDNNPATWSHTFSNSGACPVGKDRKVNTQGRLNASVLNQYTPPEEGITVIVDGAALVGANNSRSTDNDIVLAVDLDNPWQFMFGMWADYNYLGFAAGVDEFVFRSDFVTLDLRLKMTNCKPRPS